MGLQLEPGALLPVRLVRRRQRARVLRRHSLAEFDRLAPHLYTWAPLHYVLSNVATCLAAADFEVMHEYAALVEDGAVRERIWVPIVEEFSCTRQMLEMIYGGTLEERRPNIFGSLARRTAPLRVLHRQQLSLLQRWRNARRQGDVAEAEALLPHLLLTVNAIAGGVGATG